MSYTFFIPVFMVALLGAGCAGGQAPGVSGPPSDGGAVTQSVVIAPTPAPASDQAPVNKPTDTVPTPVPTPNPKPTPTPAPAPTPNPVPAPEPAPSIPMSATIQ
ncbi:hypothetical protein EXS71_01230, partial [Candidatus Uhrbacteria bacterium]|nr:hypothetical protein [Candidatus Uhrbacteria bacterium]